MDYLALIGEAVVEFFKNFDFGAIIKAFAEIDWNSVKDAVVSAATAIAEKIG